MTSTDRPTTPAAFASRAQGAVAVRLLATLLLGILLSGCSSTGNRQVRMVPLSPEEVDEIQELADERQGVLHWRAGAGSQLPAKLVSIGPDSVQYSTEEGRPLLWSDLREVSRVEFPYSVTESVAWGAVGGAVSGAISMLATTALVGVVFCGYGSDCDPDWGGAVGKGALYGGIIFALVTPILNKLDPPRFEFSVGR